ncbi:MAG: GH92 family glycosyl hydrolase [Prevotella sp.]|nr:GH92 family glycosyl hydrolase [Prevotella sp.]
MMKRLFVFSFLSCFILPTLAGSITDRVDTRLGTTTLWTPEDLGFTYLKDRRPWGGETFPGATTPNGMVQLTPVTKYGSGGGYQYEDANIYGFAHTAMGHWNLLNVPMLPVTKAGFYRADSYASHYSHDRETARPGYYQVYLERYRVDAELTVTPRCGYHRYTFRPEDEKLLLIDITRANGRPRRREVTKVGQRAFQGRQDGVFFYAVTNYDIDEVREERGFGDPVNVITFKNSKGNMPLEVKVGLSFTSQENARLNLETELASKSFDQVRSEADSQWETLLGHVRVTGGTEQQQHMLYSTLYRAFLWPSLLSDVNGEYRDERGQTIKDTSFQYYTNPAFWDEARNQLTLLSILQPQVATDVIKSTIERGEKQGGFMPTYFHGDHASTFISGAWLRGLHTFDLQRAYQLMLKNATVPSSARPYLEEYMQQGWIAEKDTFNVPTWNEYKAAVTKTLEYAYDDYAVALVAHELKDKKNERLLMERAKNYRNVYDPSTGFMRGRIADGSFIKDFDPYYPYYAYQYREANAWNSLFYAPHVPEGIVGLYPSKQAVEQKLDSLFTEPYRDYEADNFSGFIGNYCQGNQPGHTIPFTYYFVGRQEKSQQVLNKILNEYYGRGPEHLALPGMDDGGEMSAWYALTALGIYTYSPAAPQYIVSVPLFDRVEFDLPHSGTTFTIVRKGQGTKIRRILIGGKPLKGWFVNHSDLAAGKELTIEVESAPDAFSWPSSGGGKLNITTKREIMNQLLDGKTFENYVPTVFFMHFPAGKGRDAVYYHVRHLNLTGVDLLKIQFEQQQPKLKMQTLADWQKIQPLPADFYAPTIDIVKEVFDIVGRETMVIPTVYSAFQTLRMQIGIPSVIRWAKEAPDEVLRALRIYNDALLGFVRQAKALGIDGFFMPTQGGENIYNEVPDFFERFIRPFDMELMTECTTGTHCNILHICDWEGPYDSLDRFESYPGEIVNTPNVVAGKPYTPNDAARQFGRIVLGGLERKGVINKGTPEEVKAEVARLLAARPAHYMLGAECTIDNRTSIENIRMAVDMAHGKKMNHK